MPTIKDTTTLKKAYCTHCKTENELNRIFEANPDAEVCYCPYCMAVLKPKEAIDEYNFFISQKLLKANRLLYTDTKFHEAYNAFASIIEIDPKNPDARFGRLLALIYLSTLRHTYFADVCTLLEQEASNYFRKLKDQEHYFKMLHKMSLAVDEYYRGYQRRLMFKDRFYDVACVELYYERLDEIIEIKRVFAEEINKIRLKVQTNKIERVYEELLEDISLKEKLFTTKVATIDGGQYKPLRFNDAGQVLLSKSEKYLQGIKNVKVKTLNLDKEGVGSLIKDKVYPDNSRITTIVKAVLPITLLFLTIGIVGVLLFLFGVKKFKLYFLLGSIGGFVFAAFFLALYIIWKGKLLKRRHLID